MSEPREEIIIGMQPAEIDVELDRFINGCLGVLQEFDIDTLRLIANRRHDIAPDGWAEKMILEYLDVWR